jgi:hypothetical protein
MKFIPKDVVERRNKCDICGYELTLVEWLISGCYCIFHEKDESKLEQIKNMSKIGYVRLLLADLDVARGKIAMKEKGMTEVDYMANVGAIKPEIQDMSVNDLKTLQNYMRQHNVI